MKLAEITNYLETIAPLHYQEDYDNSGLIVGQPNDEITAALVALDCTAEIVNEAITKGCNLIITHHPLVFKGLKKFNGKTHVERVLLQAIKNNIALYAIHTNLDHVDTGVNAEICRRLGLQNTKILAPKSNLLKKLVVFCPLAAADQVRNALFAAGAGSIGNYSECSFNTQGQGTFKAGEAANPYVGEMDVQHQETEIKIETIFVARDEQRLLAALVKNHPYEEVAYEIYELTNKLHSVGAGMIGDLPAALPSVDFLRFVKDNMNAQVIRYTQAPTAPIKKVAVCGGAGSFLLPQAIAAGADAFVTADFKYHEFFNAEQQLMICDIGHYETEQFTSNLLIENIQEKFPNFAIRLTEHNTNPINYFI